AGGAGARRLAQGLPRPGCGGTPMNSGRMDHDEVLDLLPAYLADELDARARAAVSSHLDGCAICRADCEETRRLMRAVAATATPHPVGPSLADAVMARIAHGVVDPWPRLASGTRAAAAQRFEPTVSGSTRRPPESHPQPGRFPHWDPASSRPGRPDRPG